MTDMHSDVSKVEITPVESAGYIREMLVSLQKIAYVERQSTLAHLLALAAEEARTLKNDYNRDTLPPG